MLDPNFRHILKPRTAADDYTYLFDILKRSVSGKLKHRDATKAEIEKDEQRSAWYFPSLEYESCTHNRLPMPSVHLRMQSA